MSLTFFILTGRQLSPGLWTCWAISWPSKHVQMLYMQRCVRFMCGHQHAQLSLCALLGREGRSTICKHSSIVALEQAAHERQYALAVQASGVLCAYAEDVIVQKRLLLADHLQARSSEFGTSKPRYPISCMLLHAAGAQLFAVYSPNCRLGAEHQDDMPHQASSDVPGASQKTQGCMASCFVDRLW